MNKKLALLFKELNKANIVAKRNFSCCNTCGWAEIVDFADTSTIGYAFYHCQDTPSIKKFGQVYVGFGAVGDSDRKNINIGKLICKLAKDVGLQAEWNGRTDTRVLLLDK